MWAMQIKSIYKTKNKAFFITFLKKATLSTNGTIPKIQSCGKPLKKFLSLLASLRKNTQPSISWRQHSRGKASFIPLLAWQICGYTAVVNSSINSRTSRGKTYSLVHGRLRERTSQQDQHKTRGHVIPAKSARISRLCVSCSWLLE